MYIFSLTITSVMDEKRRTIVFDGLIVDGLIFDGLNTNWDLADIRSSWDAAWTCWCRLALLCVVKVCQQVYSCSYCINEGTTASQAVRAWRYFQCDCCGQSIKRDSHFKALSIMRRRGELHNLGVSQHGRTSGPPPWEYMFISSSARFIKDCKKTYNAGH